MAGIQVGGVSGIDRAPLDEVKAIGRYDGVTVWACAYRRIAGLA
jgi:hypothetical protein